MLQHLTIQNYALIEHLDIDLHQGFSVITGETGAGKSILLGAIGLLLGQRADTKSIRNGAQRCTIEAQFDLSEYKLDALFDEMDIDFDGHECIIRRELTSAGKSRAFINDTPATVAQLKMLGDQLLDIHSQHQNLLLSQEGFQMDVLDTMAHSYSTLEQYKKAYERYNECQRQLKKLRERLQQTQDEEDYLSFQYKQLEEANLQEGEDEELEEERSTMEHAEDIKSALSVSSSLINGDGENVIHSLRTCVQQLRSASKVFAPAQELAERLESCLIELKDIGDEVESHCDDIEFNPSRLAEVEERLNEIYDLQHKHHVDSISQLLQIQQEMKEKLDSIGNAEFDLQELEKQVDEALSELTGIGTELTEKRREAGNKIEKMMVEALVPLGIPNVQFQISITPAPHPEANGLDHVNFLFSANKNGNLQPISQVASGGEIARVMLSLKALISSAKSLPTIIFDEIDTGVSGQIAERMALIMRKMGEESKRQVLSITHLPQIAALGTHHYRVYKEDNEQETNSHIVELSPEERIEEIAHMLSGSHITEAARQNARTLLKA